MRENLHYLGAGRLLRRNLESIKRKSSDKLIDISLKYHLYGNKKAYVSYVF